MCRWGGSSPSSAENERPTYVPHAFDVQPSRFIMNVLNSVTAISVRMIRGASALRQARGRFLPYIAVAFISLLYCLPFMRLFLRSGDEGTFVLGALRITQGQVPFRDFFEVMAPGTFYWLALFFSLFGESWLTTRIYLTVTVVCTAVLLYYFARRLRTGYDWLLPVLFLAVGFPYWTAVSHHLDSTLFALLTLAAVLAWTDTQKPSLLLSTGALAGFTTCFMQPKGLLLILACLLTVAIKSRQQSCVQRLMIVLGGYAAVGLVVILYFAHIGALDDVVYANIVWPLTHYRRGQCCPVWIRSTAWSTGSLGRQCCSSPLVHVLSRMWPALSSSFRYLLVVCCPAILAASAISRPFSAFTHEAIPYWTIGIAIWASELHRKDMAHLFWGSPVLIILIFHLLHRQRHFAVAGCIRLVCVSSVTLATFYLARHAPSRREFR